MAKSLKSRKSKKKRPKYAYMLPEKGVLYSALGDPIILDGQNKFVCGGCFLLLRSLDVRSWLHSRLQETLQTHPLQMIHFGVSKCGCTINLLTPTPSLFPNFLLEEEFISMVFSLECRCLSEIRSKIDALFPMVRSVGTEFLLDSGKRVSWTQRKLTVLENWHFISANT